MAQIRPAKHHGFTCDNCGMDPIQGHRYKCINCEDFDLVCKTASHCSLYISSIISLVERTIYAPVDSFLSDASVTTARNSISNSMINSIYSSSFASRERMHRSHLSQFLLP